MFITFMGRTSRAGICVACLKLSTLGRRIVNRLKGHFPPCGIFRAERHFLLFKVRLAESERQKTKENIIPRGKFHQVLRATFHLTISMRGQRATGKIQRNNYHHGSCGSSLTGKTLSVSLIFTPRTHRNVLNR